jgi:hypothetical protein
MSDWDHNFYSQVKMGAQSDMQVGHVDMLVNSPLICVVDSRD